MLPISPEAGGGSAPAGGQGWRGGRSSSGHGSGGVRGRQPLGVLAGGWGPQAEEAGQQASLTDLGGGYLLPTFPPHRMPPLACGSPLDEGKNGQALGRTGWREHRLRPPGAKELVQLSHGLPQDIPSSPGTEGLKQLNQLSGTNGGKLEATSQPLTTHP